MELANWIIEIAVILGLAKLMEIPIVRLGLPRVVSYLIVGLILSIIGYRFSDIPYALATLGIVALLFYAGLETSTREFFKGLKGAGIIAVGGVISALAFGFLTIPLLNFNLIEAFAVGVIFSATSVSLTVKTMDELGVLGGKEASTIMGAAVVDDVIGLALISTMNSLVYGATSIISVIEISALAFALWLAVSLGFQVISRPFYRVAIKTYIEAPLLTLSFIILLIFSYIAMYVRLSAILLAYALGLGIASHKFFARKVAMGIRPIVALFTPIFFVYVATLVDLNELLRVRIESFIAVTIILLLLGFFCKLIGCYVASRLLGFTHVDSLIIGIGMIPRAEVMLIALTIAYKMNLISTITYTSLLLMVPVYSLIVPPLLKHLYIKYKGLYR